MIRAVQLHRYIHEVVRVIHKLSAGAPEPLCRELARCFDGVWDCVANAPLKGTTLSVAHLLFALQRLEALLLTGHSVSGVVAVREISSGIRQLIARTPFARIQQDLLRPGGVLVRGVQVNVAFSLAADSSHHTFSWSFRHGDREVEESVFYWDEHFDYGGSSCSDDAEGGGSGLENESDQEMAGASEGAVRHHPRVGVPLEHAKQSGRLGEGEGCCQPRRPAVPRAISRLGS